jgi:hypothetical protein
MSEQNELSQEQVNELLAETHAEVREILFDKQEVEAIVSDYKVRKGSGEREGDVTIQVTYTTDQDTEDNYGTTYPPGEKHTVFFLIAPPLAKRNDSDAVKRVEREKKDLKRLGDACERPLVGIFSGDWLESLKGCRIKLGLRVYRYQSSKDGSQKAKQQYVPNVIS